MPGLPWDRSAISWISGVHGCACTHSSALPSGSPGRPGRPSVCPHAPRARAVRCAARRAAARERRPRRCCSAALHQGRRRDGALARRPKMPRRAQAAPRECRRRSSQSPSCCAASSAARRRRPLGQPPPGAPLQGPGVAQRPWLMQAPTGGRPAKARAQRYTQPGPFPRRAPRLRLRLRLRLRRPHCCSPAWSAHRMCGGRAGACLGLRRQAAGLRGWLQLPPDPQLLLRLLLAQPAHAGSLALLAGGSAGTARK